MNWKNKLLKFEKNKQWDAAIVYMQNVIAENSDDVDTAICMNYLLIHLLAEEDFDVEKCEDYIFLSKKYFHESYRKFSDNAEYLFCTGMTLVMSEWIFDNTQERRNLMLQKAVQLDASNILYRWGYSPEINVGSFEMKQLATSILSDNHAIKQLKSKGSFGEYLFDIIMTFSENNKRKLCWIFDKYLLYHTKSLSSLCYSCDIYYRKGLEGDVFSDSEKELFDRLMLLCRSFIEHSQQNHHSSKFYFSETDELNRVVLQLRAALRNELNPR